MQTRILPAQSAECQQLLADGWELTEESFGAQLRVDQNTPATLAAAVARMSEKYYCRALTAADREAVLELDAATLADYPGGPATAHQALTVEQATPSKVRHGYGVFSGVDGALESEAKLVGMTWVEIAEDGASAEVVFTVIAAESRGSGLGTAIKAFSLQDLLAREIGSIRTGGSMRNRGIIGANAALGFEIDERWATLVSAASE